MHVAKKSVRVKRLVDRRTAPQRSPTITRPQVGIGGKKRGRCPVYAESGLGRGPKLAMGGDLRCMQSHARPHVSAGTSPYAWLRVASMRSCLNVLYSYGLYSNGLYIYGLYSYCLYSYRHAFMGHNCIGHNYIGHNCIGHNYIGHTYMPSIHRT